MTIINQATQHHTVIERPVWTETRLQLQQPNDMRQG
jgi:hypothetical protein